MVYKSHSINAVSASYDFKFEPALNANVQKFHHHDVANHE
jgi:hypothetical protein